MIYLLYVSGGASGAMLHSCYDSLEKAEDVTKEFGSYADNQTYPVSGWWVCEMAINSKLTESKEVARGTVEG